MDGDQPDTQDGTWSSIADESWAWTVWRSRDNQFALQVVCGSVGIWEEWADLDEIAQASMRAAYAVDDMAALRTIAGRVAQAHKCGGGTNR